MKDSLRLTSLHTFVSGASGLSANISEMCTAAARCLMVLALLSSAAQTQRIPIRSYDDSAGLPQNNVSSIFQDKKGYLWIATDGLSRFDGYDFVNYTDADGLGNRMVNTIAEDRDGKLWVGTNGAGVARLIDAAPEPYAVHNNKRVEITSPRRKFVSVFLSERSPANRVNVMLFDGDDILWCGTDDGIYRAAPNSEGDRKFEPVLTRENVSSSCNLEDSKRRLWFGFGEELLQINEGRIIKYAPPAETGSKRIQRIQSIVEDHTGRLLVSTVHKVFDFVAPANQADRASWKPLSIFLKPDQAIQTTFVDSSGRLWIGTSKGLIKFADSKQTLYTVANGLTNDFIRVIYEDREGSIWIGTARGGLCKLSSENIVNYTGAEQFAEGGRIVEDKAGRIYVNTSNMGVLEIINGKAVPVPDSLSSTFRVVNARITQDRDGDWWIGTDKGLFRFKGPQLQFKRGKKFGPADGISEAGITSGPGSNSSIYEDPDQNVWIGSADGYVYCYNRHQAGRALFRRIPCGTAVLDARQFTSDRSGGLWIAGWEGVARLLNGKLVPVEGLPDQRARAILVDSRGWLWIGFRYNGVAMTTDPSSEHPSFVSYSTASGLASDSVWSITEDNAGEMYFGTGQGLDQLDPATGRIRHFTKADGLAGNNIGYCMKDRHGNIWVATNGGVSKLNPQVELTRSVPAPIYFSRVQVAGEDIPLPETGTSEMPEIDIPASRNNLLIEYVGLSLQGEKKLRYQYKLEGADSDWSDPSERRSLNFASLAPGRYRMMVRAINQQEVASQTPAVFKFRILPPIWQRWWFMLLAALAVGSAAYTIYRYRVGRLVEIERVRTRIAADLHDDLGSNLTQIAMLSEVVRHNPRRDDKQVDEWLSLIANISRESVQSMSDIVWAVNPRKDKLSHVTQRMRRLASDILVARNIAFDFRAPTQAQDLALGANIRREVFLIFKEAVNNLVRHSGCSKADIEFRLEKGWLLLSVSDDGKGFDTDMESEGNGLASMRERAKNLGGAVDVISRPGGGTTMTLKFPVGHRIRPRFHRDGKSGDSGAATQPREPASEVEKRLPGAD